MTTRPASTAKDLATVREALDTEARQLGFQQIAVTDTLITEDAARLDQWLDYGYHGEMGWMRKHQKIRENPADLLPGAVRVISARMDYLSDGKDPLQVLNSPTQAYIARYALGRDYHRVMRGRLKRLAQNVQKSAPRFRFRALVDSAPVLERGFARRAGLGWIGKNTMLLNRGAGSWFFLGEIYTDLPLPLDPPNDGGHCGSCTACLEACPTDAFVTPFQLDARRCIAYLTIELRGAIPEDLRPLIGNRIFGCDDCQIVCPWNRYAIRSAEADFAPRHGLDNASLLELFSWNEQTFLQKTEGSAIRRTGYQGWLRNLAVAIGNAPYDAALLAALRAARLRTTGMVREHIDWAIAQHIRKADRKSQ